ncbi:MAG TPA: hypothetical protein VIP31_08065 [Acidovorax sp.]
MTNQTAAQLRIAIHDMDCMSQGGFSSIAAIAKLALAALENPQTCGDIDSIAAALESIRCTAKDIENCINATAEGVGCHYVDAAQRRRWDAMRKAREEDGTAATSGGAATVKG